MLKGRISFKILNFRFACGMLVFLHVSVVTEVCIAVAALNLIFSSLKLLNFQIFAELSLPHFAVLRRLFSFCSPHTACHCMF